MNETELVVFAAGLVIGTSCGFMLAALMAAGVQQDRHRAYGNALREEYDELERQAAELNRGFTTDQEIRA